MDKHKLLETDRKHLNYLFEGLDEIKKHSALKEIDAALGNYGWSTGRGTIYHGLNEFLKNSHIYGNDEDPSKYIRLECVISREDFHVKIKDEGEEKVEFLNKLFNQGQTAQGFSPDERAAKLMALYGRRNEISQRDKKKGEVMTISVGDSRVKVNAGGMGAYMVGMIFDYVRYDFNNGNIFSAGKYRKV